MREITDERTELNYDLMLENFCRLCDTPTSNMIWCDELCRSLELYGVFTTKEKEGVRERSWRKNIKPDPDKWKLWVSHRYGTPPDEVEEFVW